MSQFKDEMHFLPTYMRHKTQLSISLESGLTVGYFGINKIHQSPALYIVVVFAALFSDNLRHF